MTAPRVGKVYADGAPELRLAAPESDLRTRVLARITADRATAWDTAAEQALDALAQVLDWHRPWQHWEQVFQPSYQGDRYLGVGCRSCGVLHRRDCPTVLAVATALGIST